MTEAGLSSLPLDVLVDAILPQLPTSSISTLSRTNKSWQSLIAGPDAEVVWRRKAEDEFNFPSQNTGRRTGWRELYRRLQLQSVFVWGQNQNGRLGHAPRRARAHLIQGGFPIPTRLDVQQTIVGLEAGGFSFHALTNAGEVVVWGTMDGELTGRGSALSYPGLVVEEPIKLPMSEAMGHVVQLEAGRKHAIARNQAGEVWEYRSFGRAYQVLDERWGPNAGPSKTIVQVEAGWQHSLVLTSSGTVFVWWELGPAYISRLASDAGEAALPNASRNGIAFTAPTETVQLPDLPASDILKGEKIEKVASGDHFVLALTTEAKLFFLDISPILGAGQVNGANQGNIDDLEDSPNRGRESRARLEAAFHSGSRRWQSMERFYDLDKVGDMQAFGDGKLAKPKAGTRITSISAHFHSFVAYSVPLNSSSSDSLVLMGDDSWTADSEPVVIPELQGKSVIKVVQGDYHNVALTSNGQLYSWGQWSAGALGLGHPTLLNTPMSAPHPPPALPAGSEPPPPAAARMMQQGMTAAIFPGFARSPPLPAVPQPPQSVDVPTLIRFPGESDITVALPSEEEEKRRQGGKFVFHVSASGWHTGCLAVELGEDATAGEQAWNDDAEAERQRDREAFEQEQREQQGAGRGVNTLWRGGHPPFRIGFPARGIHRIGGPATFEGAGRGAGGGQL